MSGRSSSVWADAGRLTNKQNSFDDLYAIAEGLVATGVTTPDRLAVTGRNNGGIMSGVAFTQRPDLRAAVAPQCPVTRQLVRVRRRSRASIDRRC